jgi:hypothetical protein
LITGLGSIVVVAKNIEYLKGLMFGKEQEVTAPLPATAEKKEVITLVDSLYAPEVSERERTTKLDRIGVILDDNPGAVGDGVRHLAKFVRDRTRWPSASDRCSDSQVKHADVSSAIDLLFKHRTSDSVVLDSTNLSGLQRPADADLRNFRLRDACLNSVKLPGARFDSATLTGARGESPVFAGAQFRWADLNGVAFQNATFRGATLQCADLLGATLRSVDLWEANLSWSQLDEGTEIRLKDTGELPKASLGAFVGDVELDSQFRVWLLSHGAITSESQRRSEWTWERAEACKRSNP